MFYTFLYKLFPFFIELFPFSIRVISLTTGNMVPGLARPMEMTTNLEIFEQCRNSEDGFIANRKFKSFVRITGKQLLQNV